MSLDRRNLLRRVLVALVGIPLTIFLVLSGGWGVVLFATVLSIVGGWEWADLCGLKRMRGLYVIMIAGPSILLASWLIAGQTGWMGSALVVTMLAFLLALIGPWQTAGVVRPVGATLTGTLYVGFFGLMVPISRGYDVVGAADGSKLIVSMLFMLWLCDTLAYFGGSAFGTHRLAPAISPQKSWEGAVCGFGGSLIGGALGWAVLRPEVVPLSEMIGIAAVIGIVGQIGDLAESAVKRDVKIKDSSTLLPGHGGALDRFDSLLFSLPVLWLWLRVRPLLFGT